MVVIKHNDLRETKYLNDLTQGDFDAWVWADGQILKKVNQDIVNSNLIYHNEEGDNTNIGIDVVVLSHSQYKQLNEKIEQLNKRILELEQ